MSVEDIAQQVGARVMGPAARRINGVDFIERAGVDDLAFVGSSKHLNRIEGSSARVVIAPEDSSEKLAAWPEHTFLIVRDPEVAFLKVAEEILPQRIPAATGISSRAVVDPSAVIGAHSSVQPLAVVGRDVVIGENCVIGSGAVIGDGCTIGDNCRIDPNVVLYPDVIIGSDVKIQAGCVLGGDGFGYRNVNGRHERLPHVGTVRICDDVHIGACCTIDRAKVGETVIGTGTRIDSMVVIGHNCQIGEHNLLVSQAGIAGSSSTGKYVVCAGQAGIADHVHLGDFAIIGAKAGVHRDMPGGEAYLGSPARKAADVAREQTALKRLPELRETVRALQKQVAALQQQLQLLIPDAAAGSESVTQETREAA
ncbi:MAG: UDP-3-O-(3-hydroxymyristoyl)glucosamine N-acyltransferase [Planctomycetaceae bacterium]